MGDEPRRAAPSAPAQWRAGRDENREAAFARCHPATMPSSIAALSSRTSASAAVNSHFCLNAVKRSH